MARITRYVVTKLLDDPLDGTEWDDFDDAKREADNIGGGYIHAVHYDYADSEYIERHGFPEYSHECGHDTAECERGKCAKSRCDEPEIEDDDE